jgi:hypothetical protein
VSNAIDWVEENLGLTALEKECDTEQDVLDDLASRLDNATDEKRTLGDKIKDRETQLLIEERGKHPDQSQAWLDRHMIEAKYKDPELIVLRADHQAASSILSGLEYDWEVQKSKVRKLSNRMIQNGGYLNFLAAAKLGEIATALVQVAPSLISAAAQTLKTQSVTETQGDSKPTGNAAG